MAVNVFLVFYFRTSPDSFRRWWWLYCLICYGGPLVIALALLLVKSPRGPIYGQATVSLHFGLRDECVRTADSGNRHRSGVGSMTSGTASASTPTTC